jgi:hypothetical protein
MEKQEPKRIQRLRALAVLGAHGNRNIEKCRINGMWAQLIIAMYDDAPPEQRLNIETKPIDIVLRVAQSLLAKGAVQFKIG